LSELAALMEEQQRQQQQQQAQQRPTPARRDALAAAAGGTPSAAAAGISTGAAAPAGAGAISSMLPPMQLPAISLDDVIGSAAASSSGAGGDVRSLPFGWRSWRLQAAQTIPEVYQPDWHVCLPDLLLDLWPSVADAHEDRDKALLQRAYVIADLAMSSQDALLRCTAATGLVMQLDHNEYVLGECCRYLQQRHVQGLLLPLVRLLQPQLLDDFLLLARDHHPGLDDAAVVAGDVQRYMAALQRARSVHGTLDWDVLCFSLGQDCLL
jgi:hypothetical protein